MESALAEAVRKAVTAVEEGVANRLDGDGFKVYKVGAIIRVDLQPKGE